METHMPSNFFWYEVVTTDTKAAEKFYRDVFGWSARDSGNLGMPYTVFSVGERAVAGLMAMPEEVRKMGTPPFWMGYIGVDDVDGAVERIAKEGGKIYRQPFEVPGIVRLAVVADPQGVGFIVAKDLNPMAELPPGTPSTVGWHELYAIDWQKAFAFYEKLFGWTKADAHDMGPMGTYQLFAAGGVPIGGMMTKPAQVPVPHWGYYINVPSIDAGAAKVTAGGGKILNGPVEVPGGQWVVNAMDPQGAAFSLV